MSARRVATYVIATALLAAVSLSPTSARETSSDVDLYVPSDAASPTGIAVRVSFPSVPRYQDGAPIAIFVAGGGGADAFVIRDYPAGVVAITFAFPSGELDGRVSGGTADARGPLALGALGDVVAFALGRTRSSDGRSLKELAPYSLRQDDVGLVGWSRGGDAVINALARYPEQTRGVAWIVNHESPAFDAAMTGEIVVRPGAAAAPADYVSGSCARLACEVQHPSLRWDPATRTGGTFYLDRNGSGRQDATTEPALPAFLLPGTTRRVFPLSAIETAVATNLFGSGWSDAVATLDETRDFWAWRDARWNLATLIDHHRSLAAILHVTEQDHAQSAADHPHVALVYNALVTGGLRFARINPDAAYTVGIGANLPDTVANAFLPSDFGSWLVPEASAKDTLIVNAAIYELADRVRANKWDVNLSEVVR
jgi:hypothetical protein